MDANTAQPVTLPAEDAELQRWQDDGGMVEQMNPEPTEGPWNAN